MEDEAIINLFFARDQEAITATDRKYGRYCYRIANNILSNQQDAEESVSDTYYTAWDRIPPTRPSIFSAFLGKITRDLSLDKWRARSAAKRGGREVTLALEELQEIVPGGVMPEEQCLKKEAALALNGFLDTLPEKDRWVILRRYWYLDTTADIAARYGFSEAKVKSILRRGRAKLKNYFEVEGLL